MRLINNKKAVRLLGEHTVNLVITVIVVVILIVLVVKVYGVLSEKTKIEKAVVQLEKIVEAVNNVYKDDGEKKVEVFSPDKGWILASFGEISSQEKFEFPEGECRGKKSCLCICEEASCSDPKSRKCEGFDYNVKVRGFVRTVGQRETGERYSIATGEFDSIILPTIGEVLISKEGNKENKEDSQISIYGESYGEIDKGQEIYYKL